MFVSRFVGYFILSTKFHTKIKLQTIHRFYSNAIKHQTAGIIVIGNEILNSQVNDSNSHYICKLLYQSGVKVKKISIVEDDIDAIAEEVKYYSEHFGYVITSGGIGPTHDDVTFQGLAKAFNERLEHNSVLVDIIQNKFEVKDKSSPDFKMALIPENATLHFGTNEETGERLNYPCVQVKNVFLFPGSPHFLQSSFGSLCKVLFSANNSFYNTKLYLNAPEASFADALTTVSRKFPSVKFGSYPQNSRSCYKALVTLESDVVDEMNKAKAMLESLIPSQIVLNQNEILWRNILSKYQQFIQNCKNYHLYHNTMSELKRLCSKPEKVVLYLDEDPATMALLQLVHIVMSCDVSNNPKLKVVYLKSNESVSKKIDDLVTRFRVQAMPSDKHNVQEVLRNLERDSNVDIILLNTFSYTAEIFNQKLHCPLKDWTTADVLQFIRSF